MLKASGVLVAVLGLVMFTRGMNLFGVSLARPPAGAARLGCRGHAAWTGTRRCGPRWNPGSTTRSIVQKGVPVRWTISVKAEDLNGCNNPLTVPEYGIRKQLVPGDNLIEFTPDREGIIGYTCWMGMISSAIRVVPDVQRIAAGDLKEPPKGDIASALGRVQAAAAAAPPRGVSRAGRSPRTSSRSPSSPTAARWPTSR